MHGHAILFSSKFQDSVEKMKYPEGIELLRKRLEDVVYAEANYAFTRHGVKFKEECMCCTECVGGYSACDAVYEQPERYKSVYEHPACISIDMESLNKPEILFHINELIKVLQTHRCCFSCWKYNKIDANGEKECDCRFKFPKALSDIFEFKVEEYIDNVTGTKRYKHSIIYKRTTSTDTHINAYHPLTLFCWKANHDLQFIGMLTLHYKSIYYL